MTTITKTKDEKVLKVRPTYKHTGWLAHFRAIVDAGVRAKAGMAISTLKDSESYMVLIPTNCQKYYNVIDKNIKVKHFQAKDKDGNKAYTRLARKSMYVPFRNFFKGHGDAVICYTTGKQIKADKSKLEASDAVVAMTEADFDKFYSKGGIISRDEQLIKLKNSRYKNAEHRRLALCMRYIELFAKYMKADLITQPKQEQKAA